MKRHWKGKRILAGVLVAATLFSFTGCSLAKKDAGEEKSQDRLIGVFITTESISNFDADGYFEENVMDFITGDAHEGEIIVPEGDSADRIYATIDKIGSDKPEDWIIRFGDYEGMQFFDVLFEEEQENPFRMLWCHGVCEPKTNYFSTDDGESVEIKGTVYVPITKREVVFYNNPVYQTPEGKLYTVPAMGNGFGNTSEGITMTETWTGEIQKTEDGKKVTEQTKVEITYKCSYEPKEILVHQMDRNNQLVKTEHFQPGNLPEEMITEESADYLIIETKLNNPTDSNSISREICEKDGSGTEYFETLYNKNGLSLEQMSTRVLWGQKDMEP